MQLVDDDVILVFCYFSSLPVSLHQLCDSRIFQHHHLININKTTRELIPLFVYALDHSEAVDGVKDHFLLILIESEVFNTSESPVYLST